MSQVGHLPEGFSLLQLKDKPESINEGLIAVAQKSLRTLHSQGTCLSLDIRRAVEIVGLYPCQIRVMQELRELRNDEGLRFLLLVLRVC